MIFDFNHNFISQVTWVQLDKRLAEVTSSHFTDSKLNRHGNYVLHGQSQAMKGSNYVNYRLRGENAYILMLYTEQLTPETSECFPQKQPCLLHVWTINLQ